MSTNETTLDQLLQAFKRLPDWDRYPLPEVMYEKFGLKKPQPLTINECATYTPPVSENLNKDGKVEIRPLAEGGVREIKEFMKLPTEVKMITDETADDTKPDSDQTTLSPPTEHNTTETQPESDRPSQDLSCA